MVQIHFINRNEIFVSHGCLALHKKQFNFNKLVDNRPGVYSVVFIQTVNPLNKDRLTNWK